MIERKNERVESLNQVGAQDAVLHDLSKTGVNCLHPVEKQNSSVVKVKVNELTLDAKVIYCQKRKDDFRLGLNFINMTKDNQAKLDDIVERFSKGIPVTCAIFEEEKKTTPLK